MSLTQCVQYFNSIETKCYAQLRFLDDSCENLFGITEVVAGIFALGMASLSCYYKSREGVYKGLVKNNQKFTKAKRYYKEHVQLLNSLYRYTLVTGLICLSYSVRKVF